MTSTSRTPSSGSTSIINALPSPSDKPELAASHAPYQTP